MFAELHRVAFREQIAVNDVARVLSQLHLIDITNDVIRDAAHLPHHIRTLDAIHLATAQRLSDSGSRLLTYDNTMLTVANQLGLQMLEA